MVILKKSRGGPNFVGRNAGFFNGAPPLFKNPVGSYFSHMHRFMADATVKK